MRRKVRLRSAKHPMGVLGLHDRDAAEVNAANALFLAWVAVVREAIHPDVPCFVELPAACRLWQTTVLRRLVQQGAAMAHFTTGGSLASRGRGCILAAWRAPLPHLPSEHNRRAQLGATAARHVVKVAEDRAMASRYKQFGLLG